MLANPRLADGELTETLARPGGIEAIKRSRKARCATRKTGLLHRLDVAQRLSDLPRTRRRSLAESEEREPQLEREDITDLTPPDEDAS